MPTVQLLHGAQWTGPGNTTVTVGADRPGRLVVESGSIVSLSDPFVSGDFGSLEIGTKPNGDGEVIVRGPGSQIVSLGRKFHIQVGGSGRGALRIRDGGSVVVSGVVYVVDDGTVELDGGTLAGNDVGLAGGTLTGEGDVVAMDQYRGCINGGVISPGSPNVPNQTIGTVAVFGNYEQTTDGVLEIELGGADLNDQLRITNGNATLGGTLKVTLADLGSGTFIPGLHDTFDLITVTGGSVLNGFDEVEVPYLGTTRSLQPVYSANSGMSLVPQFIDALPDYNQNGIVDAADYTIWRDTLGSRTDLRANGTDEGASFGVVDLADYQIWKSHFGEIVGSGVGIPEPATAVLMAAVGLALACGGPATLRLQRRETRSY
jgi:T5SS/PEP-CTERM-associated repeat protein